MDPSYFAFKEDMIFSVITNARPGPVQYLFVKKSVFSMAKFYNRFYCAFTDICILVKKIGSS